MDAVGHRVVHGGPSFTSAVVVDDKVRAELEESSTSRRCTCRPSLAGLDAVRAALPSVPSVACFDTAFHATIPAEAATYALPEAVARARRSGGTASMGCRMRTRPGGRRRSSNCRATACGW